MGIEQFAGWVPDKAVRDTTELRRIYALPRRTWDDASATALSHAFSAVLRKPFSSSTLFPVQAQALNDAGLYKGLFASIRVGGGKTLLSLLIPTVCQLQRPLLLVPASIKSKTKREMLEYARDWNILYPRIRIETYEALGRDGQKNLLTNYHPDGIIGDEIHRLKNAKAAVTRRVMRYMGDNPDTRFYAMSGTITKRSLKDYAHILRWVFKDNTPLPRGFTELEDWCAAIDEKTNPLSLWLHPGAILNVMAEPSDYPGEDQSATGIARRAVARRRNETPGVVATKEGFLGCSLIIDHTFNDQRGRNEALVQAHIGKARNSSLSPDDWWLPDGLAVSAIVKQLSLGFYYRFKEHPPEPWKILRQVWYRTVREWIKHPPRNNPLDTKFQVEQAVAKGELPDEDDVFAKWREIEPTYKPETVAVWVDDGCIEQCSEWLHKHPKGICWVEYGAFGDRLSEVSGIPFYRNKGLDASGRAIEQATGPIIASVASNATGRNLQRWNENLVVSPSPNAIQTEQRLGRTHRTGQDADEVTDTYLISCIEHVDALDRLISDARYIEDSTSQAQKILHSDLTLPDRADKRMTLTARYMK